MSYTVLAVEDNALFVRIYKALFASLDCRVVHAGTVTEALEILKTERPNLAVVDLSLPDGSGLEVARAIREREELESIPVFTVATPVTGISEAAMRTAGNTVFLPKPIAVDEFVALARRYLDGARS